MTKEGNDSSLPSVPSQVAPSIPSEAGPFDSNSERDIVYPYSLPAPPKSYLFGGAGWGFGIGCGIGPFFGIGVGFGIPYGAIFGAGPGVGAVCGVGFSSGLIIGNGSAYIPFGFESSMFFAPRMWSAERVIEKWRKRALAKRTGKRWEWLDKVRTWMRDRLFQTIHGKREQESLQRLARPPQGACLARAGRINVANLHLAAVLRNEYW